MPLPRYALPAAVGVLFLTAAGMLAALFLPGPNPPPADPSGPPVGVTESVTPSTSPPTPRRIPTPPAQTTEAADPTRTPPRTRTPSLPRTTRPSTSRPPLYANCEAMWLDHPTGVAKGHPGYRAALDPDKDDWACDWPDATWTEPTPTPSVSRAPLLPLPLNSVPTT